MPYWQVVYPTRHKIAPQETRTVLLINKNLDTNHWEALDLDSSDITAVVLSGNFGLLRIFNVYNDCTHSRTLRSLERYLATSSLHGSSSAPAHDIWIGDFNRHDPLWEHPDNAHLFTNASLNDADILIGLLADFSMDIALEPGVPTLEHFVSKKLHRADQVFCSHGLSSSFDRCEVLPHERPPKTDHFPIISIIDLSPSRTIEPPRRNFKLTDWDKFDTELKSKLANVILRDPADAADFDLMLEELSGAIESTIKTHVPFANPSPYSKRWWTKELAKVRTTLHTLAKKAHKL